MSEHGGAREGAGRKPLPQYPEGMRLYAFNLPKTYVDFLTNLGDGNRSAGLRRFVEENAPAFARQDVEI